MFARCSLKLVGFSNLLLVSDVPIIEPEFMILTSRLDMQAFWDENQLCENFTNQKPRCAASFSPDDHWLFEFMAVPSTLRYYHDKTYRDDLHR